MKKVMIEPGVCGFVTAVEAVHDEDEGTVTLKVKSGCQSVMDMMTEVGDTFEAYALCLAKPGDGPLYAYAREKFPGHASCPVLAGILKCAEVACGLALAQEASIRFTE